MELTKAHKIAMDLVNRLAPYCNRVDIAGSIRREKADVKDIEIVCLPLRIENFDLWGQLIGSHVSNEFRKVHAGLGNLIKGNVDGRYNQFLLAPSGIALDLFMPVKTDYFRQLAIRTGSAEFSNMVIAKGWRSLGWVGTKDGLRRADECHEHKASNTWTCIKPDPTLPPVWASETEFLDWLGLGWVDPTERHLESGNGRIVDFLMKMG